MKKHAIFLLFLALSLGSCAQNQVETSTEGTVENTATTTDAIDNSIPEEVGAPAEDLNYIPNTSGMVEKGNKVAVHYTGTLEDGTKFDSSLDRGQPLEFTAGTGQMIPGFDAGVMGMKVGDKKTLTLPAAEAYGEYDEAKKQVVPKADLESFKAAGFELVEGEKIPTQFGNLVIVAADDETVTLDLNHELAGKTLIFDIELVSVN